MYLNRLSGEQKELFLDLCIHASKADGIFAEEEKRYIQQYCVKNLMNVYGEVNCLLFESVSVK